MDSILSSRMNFLYMALALYLVITSAYIAFAVKDEKTKLKYRPMHVANFALTLLFIISPLLVVPIYAQKENIIFIIIPLVIILISLGVNIFRKNFKSAISKEKNIAILALVNSLILILLVIAIVVRILQKQKISSNNKRPVEIELAEITSMPEPASDPVFEPESTHASTPVSDPDEPIRQILDTCFQKHGKKLTCANDCIDWIEKNIKTLQPVQKREKFKEIFIERLKQKYGENFEITKDDIIKDDGLKDIPIFKHNLIRFNYSLQKTIELYYDNYVQRYPNKYKS